MCDVRSYYNVMNLILVNFSHELAHIDMTYRWIQKWILVTFEPIPTLYNFSFGLLYRWLALMVIKYDYLCGIFRWYLCLNVLFAFNFDIISIAGDIIKARVCFLIGVLVRVFVAKWTLNVSPSDRGRQLGPPLIHPFHHPNISLCHIFIRLPWWM